NIRPIVSPVDSYNAVWGSGSTVFAVGSASILRCTGISTCANENVPLNCTVASNPGAQGPCALYGIWGTSLTSVTVVGASGRILQYDGSTWKTMVSPTQRTLSRVWGSSPSDVWAVGDSVLLHFDGGSWKNVPMTGDLAALQSSVPAPLQ